MSEKLENRAEIVKLARLLGRDPETLEYLTKVPSSEVRELRDLVAEAMFSASGAALGRLASASKLLPVGVVASMGEKVFGPVLSARVAGLLEPDRAVEMAARLPVSFLADVAIELDPRRAHDVIARIPPRQVADVTRELVRREEYVTMGCFVGHLERPALIAAVEEIDDEAVLPIAFVLESKEALPGLIDLLGPARLDNVIDNAAAANLWPEALDLFTHLTEAQRRTLIDRAAARDDSVLNALIAAAQEQGMWHAVLPLTRLMSEDSLHRFATLPAIQADGVLENIVQVAISHTELWNGLIPIVPALPEASQARVVRLVSELDPKRRKVLVDHARTAGVFDELGPLAAALAG